MMMMMMIVIYFYLNNKLGRASTSLFQYFLQYITTIFKNKNKKTIKFSYKYIYYIHLIQFRAK